MRRWRLLKEFLGPDIEAHLDFEFPSECARYWFRIEKYTRKRSLDEILLEYEFGEDI
jgi:hypothetical protein